MIQLSVFNKTFWDFFLQKVCRNVASVKYQWLLFMYIPVIWGMFHIRPETKEPWISATLGLTFLGGGFITLATSRIIANTSLINKQDDIMDTDK